MKQDASINPITNIRYYDIVRTATIRIIDWFVKEGCYTYKKGVSNEKSAKAVRQLLLKEPEPLIDYLYGLSRLKRMQINGKGTKKEPYTAVWCTDYLRYT